jgi:hypothetical protein
MSAASDELAARIAPLLPADGSVIQKKMFGGIGYLVNGNMFAGASSKGELMVKLDKNHDGDARTLPGAAAIDFDEPRRGGYVFVPATAIAGAGLQAWFTFAHVRGKALPPK